MIGLIENQYITDLAKIQGATKPIGQKAQLLVKTLCKKFKKHFRNLAWIKCCNKVAEIDRIKGITRAEKRKGKRFKTNTHHKTRNKIRRKKASHHHEGAKIKTSMPHKDSLSWNKLVSVTVGWIERGEKFLGF